MMMFGFTPRDMAECNVNAWIHTTDGSTEMRQRRHPAVIICPGGGYVGVSAREAEPVAEPFFAAGYNVFILYYSVGEKAKNFTPLMQLATTIDEIRKNSDAWHTDKDKIAVCGFSAGGHLACSLGTLFNEPRLQTTLEKLGDIRPNAMILCYPVITADQFAHVGSIENVSGAEEGSPEYRWFGLDNHVDSETPPAFIWHTAQDQGVPVENSLRLACALSAARVPFELHVFPHGGHGMSVCTKQVDTECPYNGRWVEMCITWLNRIMDFTR